MKTFSERHGFQPTEPDIVIRNEAPEELRGVVVDIAEECGVGPHSMRDLVCKILRRRADANNWSAYPNVDNEVRGFLDDAQWYEVYDVIESVDSAVRTGVHGYSNPAIFTDKINRYFRQRGIGWQLVEGEVQMRGSEAFEGTLTTAHKILEQSGRATASNELYQAIRDLSARPDPDITGAIQHAMAALECVARDVSGDPKSTLGVLISKYPKLLPKPLDVGLEKLWGFASEQGRHLREGRVPDIVDAELTVQVSAAVAQFLIRRLPTTS
jgi:hypothetical protein